jgi:hypothetical protein
MPTETLLPDAIVSAGGWINSGTTDPATLTNIDEGVTSPDGDSVVRDDTGPLVIGFPSPFPSVASINEIRLRIRARRGGDSAILGMDLLNGSTVLGSFPVQDLEDFDFIDLTLNHSDAGNGPPYSSVDDLRIELDAPFANNPLIDALELLVDYTASVNSDATIPIEWVDAVEAEETFPVAWLADPSTDADLPVEWTGYGEIGIAFDFNVAWLGAPSGDVVLPVSWLADSWAWAFPIEWTASISQTAACTFPTPVSRDAFFPIEWVNANECATFPVEWLGSPVSDPLLNFEWLEPFEIDEIMPLEMLLRIAADADLPVSWPSLTVVDADGILPVEWRTILVVDSDAVLVLDWLGSPAVDQSINLDWLGSLEADWTFPAAWLLGLEFDSADFPASWGLTVSQTLSLPLAWAGTATVNGELSLDWQLALEHAWGFPFDWDLGVVADWTFPVASVAGAATDFSGPLAWAGTVPHDVVARIEWTTGIEADRDFPADWILGATATADFKIAWLIALAADVSLAYSRLGSPAADRRLNLDWFAEIELDAVSFPLEWLLLTTLDSDHVFNADWLDRLSVDYTFPVESLLLTVLTVDADFGTEWTQGVSASASFVVSWLVSPAGDAVLNVSWSGALTATVACSSQGWSAEDSGTCWEA